MWVTLGEAPLDGCSVNLQSQHPALTKVTCTLLTHPVCSGAIAIRNDYGRPHSKKEKKERTKGSLAYNSSETQPGRCWSFLIGLQRMRVTFHGSHLLPLGSWFSHVSHLSFFMKILCICSWLPLVCFLTVQFRISISSFLFVLYLFQSKLARILLIRFYQELVGLPWISWEGGSHF